ncbi:MAG: TonB-dependent receptor, partial [Prevotella sp.]|nr:TonB-dependent receptor [Candidatus Prevotella equi]
MKKILIVLAILCSVFAHAEMADSVKSVQLQEVNILSTFKEGSQMRFQPASVTIVSKEQLAANHVASLKDAAVLIPNLFIPDYGSRLTSAIYVRGIGSRINSPAVGLYVDDVPYMDKSAFDFRFFNVERIDVMRGPQGVLYGRNTMGGLVRVFTKSPFDYDGTDVHLGYATKDNHREASLTHYHRVSDKFAFVAGGYYEGGSGFFRHDVTGKKVDGMQAGGGRIRAMYKPNANLSMNLSVNYDYSDEGAYPYYYIGPAAKQYSDASAEYKSLERKMTNNRDGNFRRGLFNAAFNLEYEAPTWHMNSVTSYQNLNDRMFMDQDFIQPDIYTLEQKQKINTLNEELIFKNKTTGVWEWLSGLNLMYQTQSTHAPVVFYNDGQRWLENSINSNMPDVKKIPSLSKMGFVSMGVNLRDEAMSVGGSFSTPTFSAALFHQSTFHLTKKLSLIMGMRFDFERMQMTYHAPATVNYGFKLLNASPKSPMNVNLQNLSANINTYADGRIHNAYFNALPKVALRYDFNDNDNVYATVSRGLRSGGYNIQMISELLQKSMQNAMMQGIQTGVKDYLQQFTKMGMPPAVINSVTKTMVDNMPAITENPSIQSIIYQPEYSWNFEVGFHYSSPGYGMAKSGVGIVVDGSLFYSRICDQQISRFAETGMGRQTVNAGNSKSMGGELSVRWAPHTRFTLAGTYGYTHAVFDNATDGRDEWTGYVPFVPKHTMNIDAAYTFPLHITSLE